MSGPSTSGMSSRVLSAAKQAEQLKDQGNSYFKKNRLAAAIDAYTEAITLCSDVPVYWTNRALCHRRRSDWDRVEADCQQALKLDVYSVKAHYMMGLALLHKESLPEAVMELEKALDLGRGANPSSYMVEEIWQELCKAKYTLWEAGLSARRAQLSEIRELCERALKAEYDKAVAERPSSDTPMDDVVCLDGSENASMDWEAAVDLREAYQSKVRALARIFDKSLEADTPAEVPEHLCCKITMDVFRDPVITPSGVSYERSVLLEHLRRVGKFDPLTRAPLEPEQLVPNLALKEAVQAYLAEHGWAYKPVS